MKRQLNWLLALLLVAMYSCSDDTYDVERNDGMVNFTVKTSIPSGIKTYASEHGGATNVKAADYDLRYILEVWTKETPRRLAYRGYKIVSDNFTTTDVTFTARLLALDYDFVFWADFVANGTTEATAHGADLHYKTNNGISDADIKANPATADPGLTAIEMIGTYKLSDDARDAFYALETVDLTTTDQTLGTIKLKRPFGKFRLIAIDAIDGYLGEEVLSAKMQYTGANPTTLPAGFNALTGEVNTSKTVDVSTALTAAVSKEIPKKIDGTELITGLSKEVYVLGFDYIFAAPAQTVSFEVGAYKDAGTTIQLGSNKTVSNIPIAENKLTTVIGNFFSNKGELTVIVSDIFNDEIVIDTQAKIIIQETLADYPTLADALNAVATGQTILVPAGVYNIGTGITIPAGVTVKGEGMDKTIFKVSTTAGGQTSVNLAGTLDGVWVMYNPNRIPGTAWNVENPAGVSMTAGASLLNSRVSGHRNGVYANNTTGITITGNQILKNRTGIQFANAVGATVSNNTITDNETMGVLLLNLGAGAAAASTFSGNTITGNWASDFENRWAISNEVTLDGNTFSNGTKTIAVSPTSGEGSSTANITKAGTTFKANVVTNIPANVTLTGSSFVNTFMIGGTPYASLTDAVTAANAGDIIELTAGTYPVNTTITVNEAITIKGAPGFASKITTDGGAQALLLTAGATIDGISFEKTDKTTQNLIGIQSTGVSIINSKFVGDYANGDGEVSRAMVVSPGASGFTISNNYFENLRQPAYIESNGTVTNNTVKGTRGFVITEETNVTLTGNTFSGNFGGEISIINNSKSLSHFYDDVATISAANNNAFVNNQVTVQTFGTINP